MSNDITELKLKRCRISNKILRLEKWHLEAKVSQLEKINAEIKESIKTANQNPYIKVLEDEIAALKTELSKHNAPMIYVDMTR